MITTPIPIFRRATFERNDFQSGVLRVGSIYRVGGFHLMSLAVGYHVHSIDITAHGDLAPWTFTGKGRIALNLYLYLRCIQVLTKCPQGPIWSRVYINAATVSIQAETL